MSWMTPSSAAHVSPSRYGVSSWIILFVAVVALVVMMAEGFAGSGSQDLTVCKDAGTGVAPGTPFTFLVDGQTLTVPAGSCEVDGPFSQGTTVTVSETIPSGIRVSDITVDPPDRVIGTPDIAGGRVVVRIGDPDPNIPDGTEVSFTNEEVPARELKVRCLHESLWPQPNDTVTITAESLNEALAPQLADAIEIWVGEADDPDQTSTNVTSATFSITAEAPSFVYGCRVRDGDNVVFSGWRRVTVGTPAEGRAVPVIFNGSRANSIDILLVPDRDSYPGGATDANFLRDAASAIRNAYYSENVFLVQQRRLNFWLAQDTGVPNGFPPPAGQNCNTEPDNFNTEYLFAQSAGILHTRALRDCAQDRLFSGNAQNFRVILHETGHAPFGLADEYCCDGGYWQPDPNPNVYESRAACEADAPNVGRVAADCREWISTNPGTVGRMFSTSDPASNDLMVDNKAPQALDLRRINAVFDSCAEGTLADGC